MRSLRSFFGGCAAATLITPAWAQVPTGPPFWANTYTTGRQAYAWVAMRPAGEFIVVWDHRAQYGVTPNDVHAQRFTSTGTRVGGEFRVNAYTTSAQTIVGGGGVRFDARGGATFVWDDFRGVVGVYGRRMSADGTLLAADLPLSPPSGVIQAFSRFAVAPNGDFVVVWEDLYFYDIMARRFDAFGKPLGGRFRVNTFTTGRQLNSAVGVDSAGNFTVVWQSYGQDHPIQASIFGQRFDAAGAPIAGEFAVNSYATGVQAWPSIAVDRTGGFIVVWEGQGPGTTRRTVWARRFDNSGGPLGLEFPLVDAAVGELPEQVAIALDEPGNFVVAWVHYVPPSPFGTVRLRRFNADSRPRGESLMVAAPSAYYPSPRVASDAVGNFVVVWHDLGADDREAFAQRYGGLFPAALTVNDQGNALLEPGDSFTLGTSWRNGSGATQVFRGGATDVVAPAGLTLTVSWDRTDYGIVADGATATCTACIAGALAGTRGAGHLDASLVERLQPDAQGQSKLWLLHIGDSFADVPRSSDFYRFIETLLHHSVTGGCRADTYCPSSSTTREQMAVFVLVAKEGTGYAPPACGTPVFPDVPASSPFCRWIEELVRRGVVSGCGGGNYCPTDAVTREQMAVFVLRTLDPALDPPACMTPVFADVPASSPFCRWIEELARRGVVTGCGGGNYCPTAPVTREQMSVFLTATFGLTLYGP